MRTLPLLRALVGLPLASMLLVAGGGSSKPAGAGKPTDGPARSTGGQARSTGSKAKYSSDKAKGAGDPDQAFQGVVPTARARSAAPARRVDAAPARSQARVAPDPGPAMPAKADTGAGARPTPAGVGAGAGAGASRTDAAAGSPARSAGARARPQAWAPSQAPADPGTTLTRPPSAQASHLPGASHVDVTSFGRLPDQSPGATAAEVAEAKAGDMEFLDLGSPALDGGPGDGRPWSRPIRYENSHGVDVRLVLAAAPGQPAGRVRLMDPAHPGRYPLFPPAGQPLAADAVIYLHPDPRAAGTACAVLDGAGHLLELFGLELEPPAPPSTPRGAGR